MGQALYRKYRSKNLSEIIGQDHITKTLAKAIETDRISHAYIFTGPRGVGKTSVARILAHSINDLPYTDDNHPIDIIEMDAASNTGIEDMRDLIEKAYIAPTSAKYKVYIIDEVHMLSKNAFNGLLKTLEEPPKHVVFILATTESHKLPLTIISRAQRFQFKPVDFKTLVEHLRHIAKLESIKIDQESLELIAQLGEGSVRDSISLLDQAANYIQPIDLNSISILLGLPPKNIIDVIIDAMSKSNTNQLIFNLNLLFDQGYIAPLIASELAARFRDQLINNKPTLAINKILDLLAGLIEVPVSRNPQKYLEIQLLNALTYNAQPEIVTEKTEIKIPDTTETIKQNKPVEKNTANIEPINKIKPITENETNAEVLIDESAEPKLDTSTSKQLDWNKVLNLLKSKYNTLYGIVRMAQVEIKDPNIELKFAFSFHQKRVNEPKNRNIILEAAKLVSGHKMNLECSVDQSLLKKPTSKTVKTESSLNVISSIFGLENDQ